MMNILNKIFGGQKPEILEALSEGAVILDVRTPAEFAGGYAEGAINIPLHEMGDRLEEIKKMKKPIVAYCRSGNRSGQAVAILKKNGISAFNAGSIRDLQNILQTVEE